MFLRTLDLQWVGEVEAKTSSSPDILRSTDAEPCKPYWEFLEDGNGAEVSVGRAHRVLLWWSGVLLVAWTMVPRGRGDIFWRQTQPVHLRDWMS